MGDVDNTTESKMDGADGAGGAAVADGGDELTQLRTKVKELEDKNLRLLAEQRNLAARNAREREEALRYAESGFAREVLEVLDNLERTLASGTTATDIKAVLDGVKIVHGQFLKALKARGIEPIAALHQPFDPAQHEALLQQPTDEHAAGTVVMEMERGYKMHDRVIRPSRVAVAKPKE